MLALVTTTALALASPVTLKNPPPFLPISQPLPSRYFASAWSPDNSSLYLASPFGIDRFIISQSRLDEATYVQSKEEGEITAMAVTPSGNVVLGVGRKVIVLEYATGSAKLYKTFETHGTAVTALAVSNDSTLIASASSKGVHIHDLLVPAKHISLPLPTSAARSVSTVSFHSHVRTRLLLGFGRDVLVYDASKPSAPVRPISVGQDVVGIACSPFSKTLVAVASADSVGLVDLDKDKGLFKTIISPETITSITFTPEGAAIYLGMRDGLRILNLRELDKEMKRVFVGEAGQGVVCLAVQKRLRASASSVKPSISNASATSSPARARAKAASNVRSPLRPVTAAVPRKSSITTAITGTPKKQDALETSTPTRRVSNRGAFSPLRNPISPRGGRGTDSSTTGVLRTRVSTSRENIFDDASDTPMRPSARAASSQKAVLLGSHVHPGESISSRLASLRRDKTRETRVASGSSARSEITRTSSNLSVGTKTGGSSLRRAPSTISISSSKTRDSTRSKTPANEDDNTHTDLSSPDLLMDPATPVSDMKRQSAGIVEAQKPRVRTSTGRTRAETGSTGLGVIGTAKSRGSTNKGKEKEVNLDANNAERCEELEAVEEDEEEAQMARERELSMQVSPRRHTAPTWVPSPLVPTPSTFPMHSSASGAYELFRGLIADMQAKSHADMKALHVDMLRMGRGLRQEMEEWGGEVKKLREENERLREENSRLRRGY
ncbi:WD40-repeat-containing domain protein [Suillus clintonianus]|uniref:WD40-repeat-containing domain protein n=1 Tax=Suillus clintonianus TaxID=1904413 RepID=UPI001B865D5A|nr:WD40-repeat-containing domain protein [Suillus clintonianus]KAG2138282.1 WD40-repeat-containing domain protein [Suillus clintonianus]